MSSYLTNVNKAGYNAYFASDASLEDGHILNPYSKTELKNNWFNGWSKAYFENIKTNKETEELEKDKSLMEKNNE